MCIRDRTNPKNTVFSSKRLIGRKYSELTEEDKKVHYEIVEAHNGDAYIRGDVGGEKKTFSPQEIASMVLAKLKADAESKLGETITCLLYTSTAPLLMTGRLGVERVLGMPSGMQLPRSC